MKKINIMVFPCGSEVGLELHRSLKDIRFIELFGASGAEDHGKSVYKNYTGSIPFINEPGFIEKINEEIEKNKIDFIFPALDSVTLALSENRNALKAPLLLSPHKTVEICRSKEKTYKALEGCSFLPKTYNSPDEVKEYPVIIKPAVGQGTQGFMIINSREQLCFELKNRAEKQVISEYLPGEEYTVDCFTDKNGTLRYFAARTRDRIKNGISVASSFIPEDECIREIAEKINKILEFRGVWFFQLKKNAAGQYRLLECAVRVAGTMCLNRAAGVNLPLLTVFDAMGYDVEIAPQTKNACVSRALYNVFTADFGFDEVYIDYDDTLIINNKVNLDALRFVYQCIQKNIKVILLTRHIGNLAKDMRAHRLFPELFDEVVSVPPEEKKKDYISPCENALFIDDSFAERREIAERFGIKVLGVDAIETLFDMKQ